MGGLLLVLLDDVLELVYFLLYLLPLLCLLIQHLLQPHNLLILIISPFHLQAVHLLLQTSNLTRFLF